jgi:hypothetical protein
MPSLRSLIVSLALLLPAAAQAAPIRFALDHGSVTARIELQGTLVGSGSGSLDGGFVIFDPVTGALSDFSLQSSDLFLLAAALPGALNALDLDIVITPGAGYSSSAAGSNPWSILLGPIDVAYSGSMLDATPPIGSAPVSVAGVVPINSFGVTAYFNADRMRLGLGGVKVGEIRWGDHVFDVLADIEFVSFAIPEPALAGLTALGLLALGLARRRR